MVEYLLDPTKSGVVGETIEAPGTDLHVPALCDVEVAGALRRALRLGLMSEGRARAAVSDYQDLPLSRHGHVSMLDRLIDLHENFSCYDATYAALAEGLGAALLTADMRLARAAQDLLDISVIV